MKKGDKPADPLELIVRRVDKGDEFHEEIVLRVRHKDSVDEKLIKKRSIRRFPNSLRKMMLLEDRRRSGAGDSTYPPPVSDFGVKLSICC